MKKLIFSSIFLFLLSFLNAQPFQEHFINPLAYDADQNFPIDLDQDGDLDIVLFDEDREVVFWLEQSEGGTFAQHVITTGIVNLRSVFCVDIDNDGDIDVLSGSASSSVGITWHQNDGNQNFAIQNVELSSISDIFCIDLDQDGDMDIVSASLSSGRIKWLENDGSQNFNSYTLHSNIGDVAGGVFAADMDMDGDIDVLSANRSVLYYFENDGAQNFSKSTLSSDVYYGKDIFALDMDGDGDLDPISASANTSFSDSKITWHRNMGDGNFTTQNIASSSIGNSNVSVAAGDLDGDGDNDVVWIGAGNDFIRARLNDGFGNFSSSYIVDYADANSLSIIDLDEDGYNDVLSVFEANNSEDTNLWLKNNGDATFISFPFLENPEGRSLFVIDMDNDSDLDVLTDYSLDRGLAWYQNDNQQFTRISIDPDNNISPRGIVAFDFDFDGDIDIAATSIFDNSIYYFENDGNQNFLKSTIVTDFESVIKLEAVDLDSDGDMDLLASNDNINDSSNKIVWLENDGNVNFTEHILSSNGEGPHRIKGADFDNDGDADILYALFYNDKIIWLENDGNENFTEHIITDEINGASTVFLEDMDGDGDLDILSASHFDGLLYLIENKANGLFVNHIIGQTDTNSRSQIHANDLDNDGDMDIAVAVDGGSTGYHYWFENEGNLVYERHSLSFDKKNPKEIISLDFDNDGDLDIVTSAFEEITWYENLKDNVSVSGYVFWDENENKVKDPSEQSVSTASVTLNPNATHSFTAIDGRYAYPLENGTYSIVFNELPFWELTTDSSEYNIVVENDTTFAYLNFGIQPTLDTSIVSANVVFGNTRCNELASVWLSVCNKGTSIIGGVNSTQNSNWIKWSKQNLLDSLVSVVPFPDTIINDTLMWRMTNFYPGHERNFLIVYHMPGPDFIGEDLQANAIVVLNTNNEIKTQQFDFSSEFRCAYDPNDKLVTPQGVGDENYTLFEEVLLYTIRFQNTGNDYAKDVVIRDTIDENLDLSSFDLISSSHSMRTFIKSDRVVEFEFKDIYLPDSTTNFIGSQGYVSYKINHLSNLPEETLIKNTANIYFDFNPPIVTNTITNTLVSQLPAVDEDNDGFNSDEDCNDNNAAINPAATEIPNNGVDEDCNGEDLVTSIYELDGSKIKIFPNPVHDKLIVEIESEGSKTYFIHLFDINGKQLITNEFNNRSTVNLDNLPEGFYILEVVDMLSNKRIVEKIEKIK